MKCQAIVLVRGEAPRKKVDGELLVGQLKVNGRLVRGRVVYRSPSYRRD